MFKYNYKFKGKIIIKVKIPRVGKVKFRLDELEGNTDCDELKELIEQIKEAYDTGYKMGKELE